MFYITSYIDKRLFNVIHLSLGFILLFTAYMTVTNMQKTINSSIAEENPEYTVDGYVSMCLLYIFFSITLWLAPSCISLVGFRICLVLGSTCYAFFIYTLILELTWLTYAGSVFGGLGAALLWSAEGQYLVLNSDEKTMSRNIGIFWSIYSTSMIWGNVYAATQFQGMVHIERPVRRNLLLVMGTVAVVATLTFALLRDPPQEGGTRQEKENPVEAFKKTWKLFCTKDMAILLVAFMYTGFQQAFGNGVYSPSLGFTRQFGTNAKLLVPISGLVYGIGGAVGGLIPMVLTRLQIFIQRKYIIIFGLTIQTIAFVCIYISLPNSSVFGETDESAYIKPMIWLALLCGFFLGVGDSCLNTQIFPLLRDLHPQYSAHTCSLYKFSKSVSVAVWFFSSSYVGLHQQLSIIFLTGIVGAAAFSYVDLRQIRREASTYSFDEKSLEKTEKFNELTNKKV